jgi:hypothetical protein
MKLLSFKEFLIKLKEIADSNGEDLPDAATKTKKSLKRIRNIETNGG